MSKEQGKSPFLPSEKQSVSKRLIQNTRQYFKIIMNYVTSAIREISSEITQEIRAVLELTTQLLQQKYNEETKEFETEPAFVWPGNSKWCSRKARLRAKGCSS